MGLMLESLFAFGGGSADVAGEATQIALRSYSREQELLADEVGAGVVSRIYGHVGGVHEAHDLLADATDERWLDRLNWSRTHPVGPERQKRVSELASNRQWKLEGALTPLDPGLAAACEIQQEQGEP